MKKIPIMLLLSLFILPLCHAQTVGPNTDSSYIVPTRQVIRPVGKSLEFGGRPIDGVLSPDGQTLYVKDNRGVVVINVNDWEIRQELKFKSGGGSMHGIAVSRDQDANCLRVDLANAREKLGAGHLGHLVIGEHDCNGVFVQESHALGCTFCGQDMEVTPEGDLEDA